ncbi:LacI family DNA-binding transcriptional regulator [Jannaschia sp. W003]|uniref:LacI family DNA-binding transcriptional regulator n=1 Tax=Jannaschia sp. W003 TaxID=2867012 RepID=UPI0021A38F79|nr:LacI family DNA-binding transcriptional regulator [Jannaschia sp. W003]UWQ21539.1 LacI family DNA-binding transcriptional regulator [Jannaschia sp. W003]
MTRDDTTAPRRPTIPDLAREAGVSVATVNRVLAGSAQVRARTLERVERAAERIDFYGRGTIRARADAARPRDRFAVLLQQPGRAFYEGLAAALRAAAAARADRAITLDIRFMPDLSPERVAAEIAAAAEGAEGVAAVCADHPLIREAVEAAVAGGTPMLGLVTPHSDRGRTGYVGLDHFKLGRTAGWAFDRLCRRRGAIGVLVGHHRFRNHGLNESGFRSYCREHAPDLRILEPRATFETPAVARDETERLLAANPDLAGLYVSGGGITGAIAALRAAPRPEGLVVVGYELFDATRAALVDGTVDLLMHHPLARVAEATVAALVAAKAAGGAAPAPTTVLPFEIFTRENL